MLEVLGPALSVVASLGALVASLINRNKLQKIQVEINGRLNQLLALTATASKLEGVHEERERVRTEDK